MDKPMPPSFKVTVTGADPARADSIRQAVETAGTAWASHLVSTATLEVLVTVEPLTGTRIAEASSAVLWAEKDGDPYQQGATVELLGLGDPNGSAPDILISLDPVRSVGVDLVTVFEHEIGHALAFQGFGPGAPERTAFDALVVDGHFVGAAAEALYGGPVPLNGFHIAGPDLMNPSYSGKQDIGALDLAFLSDAGAPVRERFGTLGNDALDARPVGDILYGGFGDDSLAGHQGSDTLIGGPGNDSVRGGKGNDLLQGGEGADRLSGDLGDDTLDGGLGADLFIFRAGDGNDAIEHFELSDRIQLAGPYSVSITPSSLETVIAYGTGDSITLIGTNCFDPGWVVAA
jgi:hypothetical protein